MAKKVHKIFISSTVEDLAPYRDAAEKAIAAAEHVPLRNEYWAVARADDETDQPRAIRVVQDWLARFHDREQE